MTHIHLTVDDVYGGWEDLALPDDLEIVLETGRTIHRMSASFRELLHLYHYALNKEGCYLGIGTGQSIEIKPRDEHVRLKKPPLDIVTTFDNIQNELNKVLSEVIRKKDKKSDQSTRNEALDYLQHYFDERGENIDVYELYEQITAN